MFDWVDGLETTGKIAGVNPAAASDTELLDAARAIEAMRVGLDAGQTKTLAELTRRGVCDTEFALSTGAWLAAETAQPPGLCKKRSAVAHKLATKLGHVLDALVAGTINFEHARVLADACNPRIEEAFALLQHDLIAAAAGTLFHKWRQEVQGIAAMLDQDGGYDPNQDLARNRLRFSRTIDDLRVLDATFTPEHAVTIEAALNTKADELFRHYTHDHEQCPDVEVPSRATLMALALVELCRQGQATDLASTRPPKVEVTLVAPATHPHQASTSQGVRLPDGSLRTLACDPHWYPLIIDALGVPLDMGHAIRFATNAQRRAIAVRDGGCVWYGCTAPPQWCDIHHVHPHKPGGQTNINVMAALCRRHHGYTHRKHWTMHVTDDAWFWWQSPSGHTFWSQRHSKQHPGPAPPPQQDSGCTGADGRGER